MATRRPRTIPFQEEGPKPDWVDSIDDRDVHSAAHLFLRAKHVMHDRHRHIGERTNAQDTMHALVGRFPDVADVAATAAHHELGIDNKPELQRVRDSHRAEHGVTVGEALKRRRAERKAEEDKRKGAGDDKRKGAGDGRRRAPRTRPVPRAASRVGQRAYQTAGGPGAADLALTVLGATVAFAAGYAVLTNADTAARGRSAVELISGSFSRGLDVFLRPVDPLAGLGQRQASNAAAGAIGRSGDAIALALAKRAAAAPATTTHVPFDPKPNG